MYKFLKNNGYHYVGDASERNSTNFPAPVTEGTVFYELDTNQAYEMIYSAWHKISNASSKILTKTNDYPLEADDYTILVDATANNVDITLLDPADVYDSGTETGQVFNIKRIDNSAFVVTVDGNGNNIDNSATILLSAWSNLQIQSNGTQWYII